LLPSAPGVAVGPVVITGTASVGRTALAVHWAHHVASRWTSGSLGNLGIAYAESGQPRKAITS